MQDDQVAIGLEACGDGPFYIAGVEDINVVIHHHDVLE